MKPFVQTIVHRKYQTYLGIATFVTVWMYESSQCLQARECDFFKTRHIVLSGWVMRALRAPAARGPPAQASPPEAALEQQQPRDPRHWPCPYACRYRTTVRFSKPIAGVTQRAHAAWRACDSVAWRWDGYAHGR